MRLFLLLNLCILWLGATPIALAEGPPAGSRAETRIGATNGPSSQPGPPERIFWTRSRVYTAKAVTASLAAALLIGGIALRRAGQNDRFRRSRDGALAALALVATLAWSNFFNFHYPGFEHPSEIYHYYVGSKYFAELGFTRLYECTAVANRESGALPADSTRNMRNLETNQLETVEAVLRNPERCKRHFSPERWRAFRIDIESIRSRIVERRWNRTQSDHGYNATPVWSLIGGLLANTGPATPARLFALSLLDPVLLSLMWGFVAWAFGWRTMCVALIYWGTSYTSQFGWNGGGFLRQDWLVASVVGICLVRRRHPVSGGFLLACAALLRIFPAVILAGVALQAGIRMIRRRRIGLSASHRKLALGGLLAAAISLPAAALGGAGPASWSAFIDNSRLHLSTPLANHLGLKTLLSYDHATRAVRVRDFDRADPTEVWKQGRRAVFEGRRVIYWILVAGFVSLLARAVQDVDDWVALALGVGMIPVATELTGYYHSAIVISGLLAIRRPSIGAALCALSASIWAIVEIFQHYDEIHTWTSLATVAFAVYATAVFCRRSGSVTCR